MQAIHHQFISPSPTHTLDEGEAVRKTAFNDHTVLWLGTTSHKVLALLENIRPDQITSDDLITLPEIA